jgi:transcriptional regulator with XRE-family HTH domain
MPEPPTSAPADRTLARNLASKIRELRARRGLTQDQVAQALSVHESAVSRWESGGRVPTAADLLALAQLFRVSVDSLFGRAEQYVPEGSVLLDQALLERLEAADTTAEFDRLLREGGDQALWLPVPEGAVLLPVAEAMRRAHRVAARHRDSAFVDRLFRPRL